MPDLVQIIKLAAVDAVEAGKPVNVTFGKVISAEPLEIQLDQKLTLTSHFLVLSRNVTDYQVEMSVAHRTEQGGSPLHTHGYSGTKTFTVRNKLKAGEKVLMLRMQGGQRYLVLDRVV